MESSIQVVQSISGSISLVSCILISIKIYQISGNNIANRMLTFLFFLDFVLAIVYTIGRSAMPYYGLCQFQVKMLKCFVLTIRDDATNTTELQAIIIQWFSLAAILWVVLMSYLMRVWVVCKKHEDRISYSMNQYMKIIFASTGILSFVLLGVDVYGEAYVWCWISPDHDYLRLGCFYCILFLAWLVIAFMLWEVNNELLILQKRSNLTAKIATLIDINLTVQKRLFVYISIFFAVWFFAILNRIIEQSVGHPVYATSLLTVIFLPLQGFFNAVAFGGFRNLIDVALCCICRRTNHSSGGDTSINLTSKLAVGGASTKQPLKEVIVDVPLNSQSRDVDGSGDQPTDFTSKRYSIFTTTLNLGEAPLSSFEKDLDDWILGDHDVYAIGLQECIDQVSVRTAILKRLGRYDSKTAHHIT